MFKKEDFEIIKNLFEGKVNVNEMTYHLSIKVNQYDYENLYIQTENSINKVICIIGNDLFK